MSEKMTIEQARTVINGVWLANPVVRQAWEAIDAHLTERQADKGEAVAWRVVADNEMWDLLNDDERDVLYWDKDDVPTGDAADGFTIIPLYTYPPNQYEENHAVAWLAESDGQKYNPPFGGISWLTVKPTFEGFSQCEIAFTRDANEALRFSRRQDAEQFIRLHIGDRPSGWYSKTFAAIEHKWIDNANPPKQREVTDSAIARIKAVRNEIQDAIDGEVSYSIRTRHIVKELDAALSSLQKTKK